MADAKDFHYQIRDVQITAPYFEDALSAGFIRRHRNDTPEEQMFACVEEALDEANLAQFDRLRPSEMEAFYTAWQADAGITTGE